MKSRMAFSYLIPIRNGLAFLPAFRIMIDNLSRNTNDEIVIVNDGSTDGTGEFLGLWSKDNPALKIVNNKISGLVNALNLGISECSNKWIARFDVDDTYSLQRLDLQAENIHGDIAAIFSDYTIATRNGVIVSKVRSAIFSEATRISLVKNRRTPHPGVIFNKAAVQSVGGYILDDFPCEDLSLWLRLSKNYPVGSVPIDLIKYRINPGSVSSTQRTKMTLKKHDILKKYPLTKSEILDFASRFEEYIESVNDASMAVNRIASSLQEIQHCSEIYGYSLPKTKEIIRDSTFVNNFKLKKEDARNLCELIIRNSYKRMSKPIRVGF